MIDAIKEGFGGVFRNRFNRFAIVAVTLIAALFGLLCIAAFWNPEEKLKDFPVAVVNLDSGEYGAAIVENLAENNSVKWEFYDVNVFQDGIEGTSYNFGFLIPENFSESVQSAQNGTPQTAEIVYFSDMRKNFLLSQFSRNIKNIFGDMVSASITREYATGAFEALYAIKDGIPEFTDGIGKLSAGTGALADNSKMFSEKMTELSNGATALKAGVASLNQNAETLPSAIAKVDAGAAAIAENAATLTGGVSQSWEAYQTAMDALLAGYEGVIKNPALSDAEKTAALGGLYAKFNAAYTGYKTAQTQIAQGGAALTVGAKELANGTSALNGGIPALTSGITALVDGASGLDDGLRQLQTASVALYEGAAALDEGMSGLSDGADKLSGAMTGGTGEETVSAEDMGAFIAEPVVVANNIYGEVSNYGTGFAPLFISLGLWIGALMLFFLIKARPQQTERFNRSQMVFGRFIVYGAFGVAESLVITGGALLLGVEVVSVPAFMLFACLISLVFVGLIQLVHLLFNDLVSKGACVILVILQISAGGGTFPVDLTGSFFAAIHPFLPFTYTIDGFREIISGGDWRSLSVTVIILLAILIASWALSLLCCKRRGGSETATA